jgi:plasmid maintenance system antidote protein VapI
MSIKRTARASNIARGPNHPGEVLREKVMKPVATSTKALALELHALAHTHRRNC